MSEIKENKIPEIMKKPEVRINGQLYRLRFDLWALEQIEKEFGGLRKALEAMQGTESGIGMVKSIKTIFSIMANCQRNMDGMPEDITGDVITKHESMAKLREISGAIEAAIVEGMKAETADGGEASDKKKNPLDEEYEAKNA